jgi:predicted nucleotidyltransferase
MISKQKLQKIKSICHKEPIEYLGLFGSMARNEQTTKSDIDLLVRYKNAFRLSISDHIKIEEQFKNTLNRDVDLVTEKSLKDRLKPYIYKDLITLYGKR